MKHDSPQAIQKYLFNLGRASPDLLGLSAMLLTVVAWAIAANVANRLFLAGVQPLELAGTSAMIATFGLALLDCLVGRFHAKPLNYQNFLLGLILVGLVGADYLAIQRLPVAVALVLLFTAPILVVLWTALSKKSLPSRSVLVALSLSLIGMLLVSNLLAINVGQVDGIGILVGLSTAVFFAAYIVLSELLSTTNQAIDTMLKTFAVASLFWLAYQLTQGIPWTLLAPEHILNVLYLGIAGNLLPYLLFFWCIQRVQAEKAALAATLEPIIAGTLAWLWFGQSLSVMQIIGGVLIVTAVTWIQFTSCSISPKN